MAVSRLLRQGGWVATAVFFAVVLPIRPCASEEIVAPAPAAATPADRVLVRVNGEPINASDLERELASRIPNLTSHRTLSSERWQEHERNVLREMISNRLVLQEAKNTGVTVSDAELEQEMSRLKARFATEAAFEKAIARSGMTEEKMRNGLRDFVMRRKMEERIAPPGSRPDTATLKEYFEKHPEKFVIPPQAEVSYLLISVDPGDPQDAWTRAKTQLEQIVEQVKEGEPFDEVASGFKDKEGFHYVNLGLVHEGQVDVEELNRVAFSLKAGETSAPTFTLFGYGVVHVDKRIESRPLKFDELNMGLFEREWSEAHNKELIATWLKGLFDKAKLEFQQ